MNMSYEKDFNDFINALQNSAFSNVHFKKDTINGIVMTILYKNIGHAVSKRFLTKKVNETLDTFGKNGTVDLQAPRHLRDTYGFNILSSAHGSVNTVNGGTAYMLKNLEPNSNFNNTTRRTEKLSSKEFSKIVSDWDGKCACCGRKIGDVGLNGAIINGFDQGHLDPRFPLSLSNCVPQCHYCNRTAKNDYVFYIKDDGVSKTCKVKCFLGKNGELIRNKLVAKFVDIFPPVEQL